MSAVRLAGRHVPSLTPSKAVAPCPFCGTAPHLSHRGNVHTKDRSAGLTCWTCNFEMRIGAIRGTLAWCEETLIAQWNKRALPPVVALAEVKPTAWMWDTGTNRGLTWTQCTPPDAEQCDTQALYTGGQVATLVAQEREECAHLCEQDKLTCCGAWERYPIPEGEPQCCGQPERDAKSGEECAAEIRARLKP